MPDSPHRPGSGDSPDSGALPGASGSQKPRRSSLDPLGLGAGNEPPRPKGPALDPLGLSKPPLDPLALANQLLAAAEGPSAPAPPTPSPPHRPPRTGSLDPLGLGNRPLEPRPPDQNTTQRMQAIPQPPAPPRTDAGTTQRMQMPQLPPDAAAPRPPAPDAGTTRRMQMPQLPPDAAAPRPPAPDAGTTRRMQIPELPATKAPDLGARPPQRPVPPPPDATGTTRRMQIPEFPAAKAPQPPATPDAGTTRRMQIPELPASPPSVRKPSTGSESAPTMRMQSLPEAEAKSKGSESPTLRMQAIPEADTSHRKPTTPPDSGTTRRITTLSEANTTQRMNREDLRKEAQKRGGPQWGRPTQKIPDETPSDSKAVGSYKVGPVVKAGGGGGAAPVRAASRPRRERPGQAPPPGFLALQMKRLGKTFDPRQRISQDDVVIFTRQFCAMVTSGLQLHQSLYFYAESEPDHPLAKVIGEVAERVGEGNTLSHSMSRYPDIFSEVYIGLIAAGESTGMLSPVLSKLADLSEKNQRIRKKVWSTLTYPMVLLAVSCLCIFAFLYFVLPMMVPLFSTLAVQLPLPTRMLLTLSEVIKHPVFIGAAIAAPILLWMSWPFINTMLLSNPARLRSLHRIPLDIPHVGRMVEKVITARILFSMATLLDSGYALNATLEKCEKVAGNAEIAWRLRKAREMLVEGCSAAECLGRAQVFPSGAIQMIAVGEEAAHLSEMISRVAQVFEDDVELALLDLAAMLEPAILIGMGLVVGFVVLAAVMPTVQLLNHL